MSSVEQDDGRGEVDGGEEVAGGLVVARGNGAILFQGAEEVLDQVAPLVDLNVDRQRRAPPRML